MLCELTFPTTTVATRHTEEAGPLRMRTSAKGLLKVRKERRVWRRVYRVEKTGETNEGTGRKEEG